MLAAVFGQAMLQWYYRRQAGKALLVLSQTLILLLESLINRVLLIDEHLLGLSLFIFKPQ